MADKHSGDDGVGEGERAGHVELLMRGSVWIGPTIPILKIIFPVVVTLAVKQQHQFSQTGCLISEERTLPGFLFFHVTN